MAERHSYLNKTSGASMEDGHSALPGADDGWVSVIQLCKGRGLETGFCLKESEKHRGAQALSSRDWIQHSEDTREKGEEPRSPRHLVWTGRNLGTGCHGTVTNKNMCDCHGVAGDTEVWGCLHTVQGAGHCMYHRMPPLQKAPLTVLHSTRNLPPKAQSP